MTNCPFCMGTALEPFAGRPDARCARCGSLERQRELARACVQVLAEGKGRRCLEIGPASRAVYGDYLRRRGWDYVSVDKWRTGNPHDPRVVAFIDHEVDVVNLARFTDDSFDLVIAQHVIEEVPDHLGALRAIDRVLRRAGLALLEIPYDPERERSQSQPPGRFGNVWLFGRDLIDELRTVFGRVELVSLEEGAYRGELMVCSSSGPGGGDA